MTPSPDFIAALHQVSPPGVFIVTGGGAQALSYLLNVPGASRVVLEAHVPYKESALADFLGTFPARYCDALTARLLAQRAYDRACILAPGLRVQGVACTASLVTDRPKYGSHRFHLAVATSQGVVGRGLILQKAARSRTEEEDVLDRVLLNTLAECHGLSQRIEVPLLAGDTIQDESAASDPWCCTSPSHPATAWQVDTQGRRNYDAPNPALLVPGSFNPVHRGHWELARAASRLCGCEPEFELSMVNADKPPLTLEETRRRAAQFCWKAPVWLTHAPTFADKADLFPNCCFAVGVDTAQRIVEGRFYGNDDQRMCEALGRIRSAGCRFLVAGRTDGDGRFMALDNVHMAPEYRDLFQAIPEKELHLDISSTQLRGSHH